MNKPGAPLRVDHTYQEISAGDPAPPRLAQIINSPYTRLGSHKTPAPTIPSSHITTYGAIEKKANIIPL